MPTMLIPRTPSSVPLSLRPYVGWHRRLPLSWAAMSPRISVDEVAHIARLARLELQPDELERFTGQLAKILDHAADMETLDLADVEPAGHPLSLTNVLRADELAPTLDREEVLSQAPEAEDFRFRVPRILSEEP